LERELIDSPAFRHLTATAILVLLDFLARRKMVRVRNRSKRETWQVANNGEIVYTYGEALRHGISRPAFVRALDALIEHGFIDIAQIGAGLFKSTTFRRDRSTRTKSKP
jgi:hypothetical protein